MTARVDLPAPPGQLLIPPDQRHLVAGFCTRCDQPGSLPLGVGQDALCGPCAGAEHRDRAAARPQAGRRR